MMAKDNADYQIGLLKDITRLEVENADLRAQLKQSVGLYFGMGTRLQNKVAEYKRLKEQLAEDREAVAEALRILLRAVILYSNKTQMVGEANPDYTRLMAVMRKAEETLAAVERRIK